MALYYYFLLLALNENDAINQLQCSYLTPVWAIKKLLNPLKNKLGKPIQWFY